MVEATLDENGFMGHHVSFEERRRGWHSEGYPCVRSERSCG
jgi:hypothetical protein